jgi:hypothetical protein
MGFLKILIARATRQAEAISSQGSQSQLMPLQRIANMGGVSLQSPARSSVSPGADVVEVWQDE